MLGLSGTDSSPLSPVTLRSLNLLLEGTALLLSPQGTCCVPSPALDPGHSPLPAEGLGTWTLPHSGLSSEEAVAKANARLKEIEEEYYPLKEQLEKKEQECDSLGDKQDDEVNADEHPGVGWAAVGHDPVVHHGVPVLSCQHLGWEGNRGM